MKILFYLRIVVMGGAERYLLTLLPELKKRNIEVGFFCTEQENNREIINYFTRHFNQYQIPVYVCKAPSPISLKAAKHLQQTIIKEAYTILSIHLIHAEIISVLSTILFKTTCKLVTTKHGYFQKFMDVHGLDYTKINKLNLSYLVERFLQNFITNNFAVSKGLAKFYIQTGICAPAKMQVIYHGMDPLINNQINQTTRYSPNQILIIGRLKKFKGHHFLIEAMNLLTKVIPDVKLVILGKGEELDNLKMLTNKYQLDNQVIFEGYTDNVHSYINNCDIVIAPSIAEPFGLVVLEAYSCAKPVVAFNVTAFNENIVNNETGCLAAPFSPESLAEKISYLLQHKNIAYQYGLNGQKFLNAKFSLTESVDNTIRFFNEV